MTFRRLVLLVGLVGLIGVAGCSSSTPVATAPSSSTGGAGTSSTVAPGSGSTTTAAKPDEATKAAFKARLLTVEDLPGDGWAVDDTLTKTSGSSTTTASTKVAKDLCPGVTTPDTLERGTSGDLGIGFGNEAMRTFVLHGYVIYGTDEVSAAFADLRSTIEKCLGHTKGTGPMPLDSEMSFIDLPTLGDESIALHVLATSPSSKALISDQNMVIGRKGGAMILIVLATVPSRTGTEPKVDVAKIIEAANAKLAGL